MLIMIVLMIIVMAFSATTLCTYTEGEIFKQARMLFEFLAQVVHCDAMVAFLHLEIRVMVTTMMLIIVTMVTMMTTKLLMTKMAIMMSIVIMICFCYRILKECLCQLTHLFIVKTVTLDNRQCLLDMHLCDIKKSQLKGHKQTTSWLFHDFKDIERCRDKLRTIWCKPGQARG